MAPPLRVRAKGSVVVAYRFSAEEVPGVSDPRWNGTYRPMIDFREQSDGSHRPHLPKRVTWLTPVERLPDLVALMLPFVSDRLRDLIERLDPGAHVFHPVLTRMQSGAVERRHLLEIGRELDAINRRHTNWTDYYGMWWEPPPGLTKTLVLDSRVIGGAHLWRDVNLRSDRNPVVSDALAQAARDAGFTGIRLDHYEQTDARGRCRRRAPVRDRVYAVGERFRAGPDGRWPTKAEIRFLDGRPDAMRVVGRRIRQPMKLYLALAHGHEVDLADVPTRAVFSHDLQGVVPDLYTNPYQNLPLTFSARLKELVEHFEPGAHRFLPLTFVDPQGAVLEERFVVMFGPPLNGLRERRRARHVVGRRLAPEKERSGKVVDADVVAGRHAWLDAHSRRLFFSAKLASIVEDAGWPHLHFQGYDVEG